jgi:Zn-dependent protease with chaperone function
MDFFQQQEKAKHNTKLLIVYFVLGVGALILTVYLAWLVIFTGAAAKFHTHGPAIWNPQLFLGVAFGTIAVIVIGDIFKTAELAQGGSAVSEMMGGRLVNPSTTNPDERKLLNVVEEMALAAGLPVPQVYVMDDEDGINAFAAGHTTSDCTVTVTRGCMKILTRDELQGVIGHEFSHILNGDMRLNLRLMGIIFGILCLAIIGRIFLRTRGRNNPLPLLGLILLLVGWIGVFFGRLIQAAVSRQREFLADASSVQFTRNPEGIVGALKKIGGLGETGSRLRASHAEEASHMFFGNGVAEPLFGLLETHPPLEERIRAIDPNFDGKFPPVRYDEDSEPSKTLQQPRLTPQERFAKIVPPIIMAQTMMPSVGAPTTAHLHYADQLRNSFPPNVLAAAREPMGASALIYGLLLSSEEAQRNKQLQLLAQNASDAIRQETERLFPDVDNVAHHAKLPLVNLALPALRHFSPAQYEQFSKTIQSLIESDDQVDLFEYVLQKIVLRHLDPQFNGARKPVVQYYTLKPLAGDCAVLLSALAYVGQDEPDKIQIAFQQGAQVLNYALQGQLGLVPQAQCDLEQVDATLNRLAQSVPQIKKNVLNACAATVAADGVIQEGEAELLRAIADTLDCPMPPFIPAS